MSRRAKAWAAVLVLLAGGSAGCARHQVPAAPPPAPSGLTALVGHLSDHDYSAGTRINYRVMVFDPRTGRPRATYPTSLSGTFYDMSADSIAFTADRRYLAVTFSDSVSRGAGELFLERRDGNRYRQVGRWSAQQHSGEWGAVRFAGGRLHAVRVTGGPAEFSDEVGCEAGDGIYTVDLDESPVRLSKDGDLSASMNWPKVCGTDAERPDYASRPLDHTGRVASVSTLPVRDASGTWTGGPVTADVARTSRELVAARAGDYDCDQQLDRRHLLCLWDVEEGEPSRGMVLTLSLSADGSAAILDTVVDELPRHPSNPSARTPADYDYDYDYDVYGSPDRATVLAVTPDGAFTAPLDGSEAPRYAFPSVRLPKQDLENTTVACWGTC